MTRDSRDESRAEPIAVDESVWETLLELGGGKPDLLLELIETYRGASPGRLARMKEAFRSSDAAVAGFEAHSLKSASEALGFRGLGEACERLERHCREYESLDGAGTGEYLAAIELGFTDAMARLDRLAARLRA